MGVEKHKLDLFWAEILVDFSVNHNLVEKNSVER
jgi:hypothetical protein